MTVRDGMKISAVLLASGAEIFPDLNAVYERIMRT